ncbi:hypothetical protein [Nocardioides coralli]|uniref:hypothetical protein n=1 Tax=Nocardioides coralli TaxID=2872154 RepID=UPI001CA3FD62|nr:hypothetical protein [Nocardioides coralli]QZY30033.1 hypothetical protein K6T13_04940 [Nocardioides coralli]
MDWDERLFAVLDDLEQQAEALYDAEREAELADRSRAEYGAVTVAARLMASTDRDLTLHVAGIGTVTGTLRRVARGWLLLDAPSGHWVVPLAGIVSVTGASDRAVPEVAWSALTRLGLGSALRRLSEAGEQCLVHRVDGSRREALLRRVGQDFVEVEPRPGCVELVPFTALAAVQSRV